MVVVGGHSGCVSLKHDKAIARLVVVDGRWATAVVLVVVVAAAEALPLKLIGVWAERGHVVTWSPNG